MKKTIKILSLALVAVMAVAMLVACGPASDYKKAEKALKDNKYAVVTVDNKLALGVTTALIGAESGDIVATVVGTNGDEVVNIWYFKDSSTAKKYWDKAKEYGENQKKDKDSDWVVKKSGKMIYFGTKQAVKDAK